MSRAASLVALAFALSGCSVLLEPDRDAIAPDLDGGADAGPDSPTDAGTDGGTDGGVDGGDAGCRVEETLETSCNDGEDNDCDLATDCFDFDCRGVATCCRSGDSTSHCLSSTAFDRLPAGTGAALRFSGDTCAPTDALIEFGPSGLTRALVSDCQPINFGMELRAAFRIDTSCTPGTCADYAALALTPLRTLVDGEPLISELRVRVSPDGSVAIDRAGTTIGEGLPPGTFRPDDDVAVVVSLEPGPDDRGRDVLYATVDVVGEARILDRTPVMPLDTLRCITPTGNEVGLFVAIEGAGNDVHVVGPVSTSERACANPSQFRAQEETLTTPAACAPGGAGAPALVSYCRAGCDRPGSANYQTDLWLDASEDQRADEIIRFVDFGVCGYVWEEASFPSGTDGDDWAERGVGGHLWAIEPEWRSGREPTLLAISDDAAADARVEKLWFAYAERMEQGSERYAIYAGEVLTGAAHAPSRPPAPLLTPDEAGCASVRDPLLLAHYEGEEGSRHVGGAWLAFTCEQAGGAARSIRAARISDALALVPDSFVTLLTRDIGGYAERGVFAAEGFTEPGDELTLRLWFLTRDGRGVHLAYAQGRSSDPDALPMLEPYPANPILAGDSPILGGDCAGGCTLTGATVAPSTELTNHYQFVLARSRITPAGPVHDLVPLLQPAPDD